MSDTDGRLNAESAPSRRNASASWPRRRIFAEHAVSGVTTPQIADLLISTFDGLWDQADRYRRRGLIGDHSQAERDQTAAEHAALVEWVIAGDAAQQIMRKHIETSLGANVASQLAASPGSVSSGG